MSIIAEVRKITRAKITTFTVGNSPPQHPAILLHPFHNTLNFLIQTNENKGPRRHSYILVHSAHMTCMNEKMWREVFFVIEGFHDAVRTPYALCPKRHVGFFWNNKICFNFVSILIWEDQTYGKWKYLHYCSYGVIRLYEV